MVLPLRLKPPEQKTKNIPPQTLPAGDICLSLTESFFAEKILFRSAALHHSYREKQYGSGRNDSAKNPQLLMRTRKSISS